MTPLDLNPTLDAGLANSQLHVIVVGNEKGGAGKSTVAMHLAIALMRMGRRVGLLDLDVRQRTLTRYIENRARTAAARRAVLPQPQLIDLHASIARDRDAAEREEGQRFVEAMRRLAQTTDFVIIDAPGGDSFLSRLAHGHADTLITPLNDSFVDFDLLGDVDPVSMEVLRPSVYAEMVWEARKRKALAARKPIDWVVMRNRLAASKIEAKNKLRVGEALAALSSRIGFRLAPGLSERVIYRELFPQGLTLLDLTEMVPDGDLKMAHLTARQEVRDLMITLKLPSFDGLPLLF